MTIDRPKSPKLGEPLFTDATWDDHDHRTRGMSPDARRRDPRLEHWAACHDLEVYMAEASDIPLAWARTLVAAALSGHPVTLTRRMRDMTVTEVGVVTQVFGPEATHFSWRTWGGSGTVYFTEVVTLHAPESHSVFHLADGDKVYEGERTHPAVLRDGTPAPTVTMEV